MSLKKEIIIFVSIFLISTFFMHFDAWMSMPIEHISMLATHPLPIHPLLYSFLIYLLISVLRGILLLFKRIFNK